MHKDGQQDIQLALCHPLSLCSLFHPAQHCQSRLHSLRLKSQMQLILKLKEHAVMMLPILNKVLEESEDLTIDQADSFQK